ncbi:hypothetical protein [Archangium gephyra]|nr:hypothetical protein [Archangium gephyra]
MRRGLLALVMVGWVAGCGRDTPPGNNPPPQEEPGDSPPQVISGSLKIHTRFWENNEGATSAYVMLGDGTRFFTRLDASGDVTFEDPSLVGPQDVTVVAHYESGFKNVSTYLALERPEVWLLAARKSSTSPSRAYISGKVKGMGDPSQVGVKAVGPGIWGTFGTPVKADGSFRILVEGTLPAVVNLVATERDPDDGPFGSKAIGLKRGIALSADQEVSGQELVLDHPVNQQTRLTLQGAEAYQHDSASASLQFFLDGRLLFETTEDGSYPSRLPSSIPSFTLTAPFDTVRARLLVDVGWFSEFSHGGVYAAFPVEDLSSVTLPLPKPTTLLSPTTLGPGLEPTPTRADPDLVFTWSTDAAAQIVELFVAPVDERSSLQFNWTVRAPGTVTSFKPFTLRLDETSSVFPYYSGAYRIRLDSRFDADMGHYADYFTQTPVSEPLTPAWQTVLDGSLDFR